MRLWSSAVILNIIVFRCGWDVLSIYMRIMAEATIYTQTGGRIRTSSSLAQSTSSAYNAIR